MKTNKITIGAFAIIQDEQMRFLFCHRTDRDVWNLPGGGIAKGESPWEAVVREVKEETGLDIVVKRLVGIYSKSDIDDLGFYFECIIKSGKITLNDEADKIKYFVANELPVSMILQHRVSIEDFVKNKTDIALKVQLQRLFKAQNGTEKYYDE